jgi:hypothetical protein
MSIGGLPVGSACQGKTVYLMWMIHITTITSKKTPEAAAKLVVSLVDLLTA